MINWIAGNWPDRFKCLVNHDGIFDQRMMYYGTEELWFPEWEHGGTLLAERRGATRSTTRSNFVEAGRRRCWSSTAASTTASPTTQGIATFTALQRRGIPSQFLYFPDENHWVLKPANSILWHDTVLAWLDRWLKPGRHSVTLEPSAESWAAFTATRL